MKSSMEYVIATNIAKYPKTKFNPNRITITNLLANGVSLKMKPLLKKKSKNFRIFFLILKHSHMYGLVDAIST